MLTPERLAETAAELAAVERSLTASTTRIATRCDCLRRVAADTDDWWVGRRADTYRVASTTLAGPLRPIPATLAQATDTIVLIRHVADELGHRLAAIDRSLAHHRAMLGRYRADVDHHWSTPVDGARAQAAIWATERQRNDIEAEWMVRSRSAADVVERIASTLPTVMAAGGFAAMPLGPIGSLLGGQLNHVGGPGEIADWWSHLAPATRRALMAIVPTVIGNLDGVPIGVRIDANRIAMQHTLDGAEPGSELWDRMQQFTDSHDRIDRSRQFLVFDPEGDGLIAEVFGDIATAEHLAVLVPGMGSTMAGFHDLAERADRLYDVSGADTAIIAWTGYDTPAGAAVSPRAFEVVTDRQAVLGGAQLHDFVLGLQAQSSGSLTLIGHSYGSLTVGKTLHAGTQVDRVVFMGSPGVGADHVDEFPAGAAVEFFASEIKGDIVANLEHFGDSPTDPDFGATLFDSGDGDGLNPVSRHSEYYDSGVAIDNLAVILTGGTPTGGRTDVIEYITEPMEDLREAIDDGIDWFQEFDIPFVDDTLIDQATEAGQRLREASSQFGEIMLEEVGHFGQDAVEWGAEQVGTAWDRGTDFVTGWFR